MKIELKNLKIAASLSEETTAYTASIYVDGKPAFHASNHGHGAPDLYQRLPGYDGPNEREINDWLAAHAPPSGPFEPDPAKRAAYDVGSPCDLETMVCRLMASVEDEKQWKRQLGKVTLFREGFGVFGLKGNVKATPVNLAGVRQALATGKIKDAVLVNESTDEALIAKAKAAFGIAVRDEREDVLERLREGRLTGADARYLMVQQEGEPANDADLQEHLVEVAERDEAKAQAYRDSMDAAHKARTA